MSVSSSGKSMFVIRVWNLYQYMITSEVLRNSQQSRFSTDAPLVVVVFFGIDGKQLTHLAIS
jgi:hypothetical protein